MERQEIIAGLVEILSTVRTINHEKLANITEDTDLIKELNIPSTEMINIIAKAEQKFDVEFEDDDIDELDAKLKSVVDLIIKAKEKQ